MIFKSIRFVVLLLSIVFATIITVSGYVGRVSDTTIMSAIITPLRRPGFSVETIYRLFDLDRGISLHGRLEDASEVRLSPDGRKALVLDGKAFGGEYRYAFYLYELTTGKRWLLYEQDVTAGLLSNHSWQAQAWSADGTQLAYFHPYERRVYVFDLTTAARWPIFELVGDTFIWLMVWSPHGERIAIATQHEVRLTMTALNVTASEIQHSISISDGTDMAWSPDGQYLLAQSISPTRSWFRIIEARTGRPVLPDDEIEGRYAGWSCDSRRVVYTHYEGQGPFSDTMLAEAGMGAFVLNIAENSRVRIGEGTDIDPHYPITVYPQTPEFCDHFLLSVVTSTAVPFLRYMDMDLSATNDGGFSLTPVYEQAQLVELYPDGSMVYRVEDRAANGVPLWHYYRYHGGTSQLLISSGDLAVLQGWQYYWFEEGVPDDVVRALAVESNGFSLSPFGRLVMVNIADQSRYDLTAEGEIAFMYHVWR